MFIGVVRKNGRKYFLFFRIGQQCVCSRPLVSRNQAWQEVASAIVMGVADGTPEEKRRMQSKILALPLPETDVVAEDELEREERRAQTARWRRAPR